jgi:hypothetical protein
MKDKQNEQIDLQGRAGIGKAWLAGQVHKYTNLLFLCLLKVWPAVAVPIKLFF